jgi:putative SOS response-associated peptidase YedK
MTDPRTPEIIAWPDTLPLTERLVTLHAMAIAFPPLQRRPDWKSRIEAAHAALSPNAEEHGFYEWKTMDGRRPKQPYRFAMTDGTPFAIAGLWARWKEPASGKTVRSFTIITTAPNALCAAVHNRMPVILGAGDHQTWLGEVAASNDELQALLRPFRADQMEAHIIGPEIGNLRRDDATLIERLDFA